MTRYKMPLDKVLRLVFLETSMTEMPYSPLTREEQREYQDLKREVWKYNHHCKLEDSKINFQDFMDRVREYNDGGVI